MHYARRLSFSFLVLLSALGAGCAAEPSEEAPSGIAEDALRDNSQEARFIRLDLLSRAEEERLDALVKSGELQEAHGAMVLVHPDQRLPEVGGAIGDALRSGGVRALAFAGMPMSLKGSVNVAKYVAKVNDEPVVAVHVGYGNMPDNGVFTYGPRAFYFERPLNASGTAYSDAAIEPALGLLEGLDASSVSELRLVGYCLGAYKVANLVRRLGESRPDLVAKMDLLMLGSGVRLPDGVRSAYQHAGNVDQFGRINSNEIDDVDIVPRADHFLRDDVDDGMWLPTFAEIERRRTLRAFVKTPAANTYAAAKRAHRTTDAKMVRLVEAEIEAATALAAEAGEKLTSYLLDDMHLAKLALWGARARLALLAARGRGELPTSTEADELAAAVAAKEAELAELDRGRSLLTDQIEYNAWRTRQFFR